MRLSILSILLLSHYFVIAQVTNYDDNKYLEFTLKNQLDAKTQEIDWSNEKLYSEFTLSGDTPLKYSVAILNDSIAKLSSHKNGHWQFQENINITNWALSRIEAVKIISEFKITDFDNDGDEDLLIWVLTNMNGNIWTLIFLNDQNQNRLVKLYNTADNTDIWDRPEYDTQTGIINCTLDAGVFGVSNVATYKLNDINIIPLYKEVEDRSNQKCILEKSYKGENGKWKLFKSRKHKG